MDTYFTVEYDGDQFDLQLSSKRLAQQWADNWWFEKHDTEPESAYDECYIIEYTLDEDGLEVPVNRTLFYLEYEYYRGDFDEHNIYWNT